MGECMFRECGTCGDARNCPHKRRKAFKQALLEEIQREYKPTPGDPLYRCFKHNHEKPVPKIYHVTEE